MSAPSSPTLDELAANPAKAQTLASDMALTLLAKLAVVHGALIARTL